MTEVPELALQRYCEFVDSFNRLKLVDYQLDVSTFNYTDMLKTFFDKVSTNDTLFNYLLKRDKMLFHKKNKLVFLQKINLYNLIESNIDETLIEYVWETIQMIYLITADNQNELTKNKSQISLLLDKLDGLGKKKGTIDLKKITNVMSKIDSSVLTEFLTLSGLDKLDLTGIDIKQLQDFKNLTPDKVKTLMSSAGLDKIDINEVINKLSDKGDGVKGKKFIIEIIEKLIEDYAKEKGDDKIDNILNFAIEKAQDNLQEFLTSGTLTLYDVIAGSKLLKESKDVNLSNLLKGSKLFRDCTNMSIKDLIAKFTAKVMSQMGKEKLSGNITEDQMNSLEEFLKSQKL